MKTFLKTPQPNKMRQPDASRFQSHKPLPGDSDDTGWLITLSDLTLLLFCFLAIWYVKQQPQDRAQARKPAAQTAHKSPALTENRRANDNAADWQVLKDELAGFVAEAGMSDDVELQGAPDEIIISVKDSISFASGKADLKPQALPVLEKVAAVAVSRAALHLRVNGHTDDRPISTAEFPSNWELSSARASRVARHLIEKGVHPGRIEVHGFAYNRPRAANEDGSGRGVNRRVEISLLRGAGAKGRLNPQMPAS